MIIINFYNFALKKMISCVKKNNDKGNLNHLKSKYKLDNIKSKHIVEIIFDNIQKKKALDIIKHNKKLQNRININNNGWKKLCEIEIEIIPIQNSFGKFININKEDELYFHIYFNDDKEEIKRN